MHLLGTILVFTFLITAGHSQVFALENRAVSNKLSVSWGGGFLGKKILKDWEATDLKKLKVKSQQEWDPSLDRVSTFKGVRLRELVEKSMEPLSIEQKAQIDLVVLKDTRKKEIAIPRWLMNKYSILLAYLINSEQLGDRGPFQAVIPWTTQSKIKSELLPLEVFFLGNVIEVKLTNFKSYYGKDFFLTKRTDPIAMRGQKRFMQTCMPCHQKREVSEIQAMQKKMKDVNQMKRSHEKIQGFDSLNQDEHRALIQYLNSVLKKDSSKSSWSVL